MATNNLAITPRARIGYEMTDNQPGGQRWRGYNLKHDYRDNCFIKHAPKMYKTQLK